MDSSSTRIKEDTAMGMILSIFYGFGIMLLTVANRTAGNQSGLSGFIFGQSASMVQSDVIYNANPSYIDGYYCIYSV